MIENRYKRGSVLMEFIIVIPIYIVLLAGLFMIGDSLMKGTQLAHEERLLAFNNETGDGITRNIFHADVGVLGPWTLRADIKKEGAYLLPEYGIAGMLLFGDRERIKLIGCVHTCHFFHPSRRNLQKTSPLRE